MHRGALAKNLASSARLQECNIDFGSLPGALNFPFPISLPALHTLVVHVGPAFDATSFVTALRFPVLECLYLGWDNAETDLDFQTVLNSHGWSSPLTPTQMTFYGVGVSHQHEEAFLRALGMVTGLERLDFRSCFIGERLLLALTPAPEDTRKKWMCP
jgi:hypothetical protein